MSAQPAQAAQAAPAESSAPSPATATGCAVAVVGAGNMGGAMVERLCEGSVAVVVCDLAEAARARAVRAGAALAPTPAQAAGALTAQGLLMVCVVDAAQSHQVLFGAQGAAASLLPGQTVMLCATIGPQDTQALAKALAERGIGCIDAPLSGGPQRAREGSMSLMLAGPGDLLKRHAGLLARLSSQCLVISERVGDAARTKLVNNLLAGINLVGAAEVLALAQRLGLDLGRTLDVIERSSGQSWIGSDRMRRAIAGDLAARAHLSLLQKDTALALQAADQVGFEGPLGARAAQVFAQASADGLAHLDDAALLQFLSR